MHKSKSVDEFVNGCYYALRVSHETRILLFGKMIYQGFLTLFSTPFPGKSLIKVRNDLRDSWADICRKSSF